MKYNDISSAVFIERKNRFTATVLLNGRAVSVHVKNTGRLRELLIEGATVYLQASSNPLRKTPYDLIAVEREYGDGSRVLFNVDSNAPNGVAAEWIASSGRFSPSAVIRREVTVGSSRIDLAVDDLGKTTYIEVKGVTLDVNGVAYFPDAPTERGKKHILELIRLKKEGNGAAILFVLQMKRSRSFSPNFATDPAFSRSLFDAANSGVDIIAVDCKVTSDSITADSPIPVVLDDRLS